MPATPHAERHFLGSESVVAAMSTDKKRWVDFMMRFEPGLEKLDPKLDPKRAGERGDDCGVGSRRRPYSAVALHARQRTADRADLFGGLHGSGADRLRRGERLSHRHQHAEIRIPDRAGRRACRRRGVPSGASVRVTVLSAVLT